MTTVKPIVEERQHHSWGLLVQGRPATPSEGRAQQYTRIGPKDSQSLITHNNGTCLEFGPWDPVDEFDETKPFYQQVLLIDTTIKDIQSVRIRHNDVVGDDDVFRGFRSIPYTGEGHQHVYPNGEVYNQVPSYYASVANTASMYSTTNKSDILGEAHPGLSSDTRFGVLVPTQNQTSGRGATVYARHDRNDRNDRFDRQNGRGNHHGERGGYSQHLNRRGRRDMQFGRGQGRTDTRGNARGNGYNQGRGDTRGGQRFEGGRNHHVEPEQIHPDLALAQHRENLARRYDAISDDGVRTWGERYAKAPIFNAPVVGGGGGGGGGMFYSADNIRRYGHPQFQEPPTYSGFDEDNPFIPPPYLWDFTPTTTNFIPVYQWPQMPARSMESEGDVHPYFMPGPPAPVMEDRSGGHSSYFDEGPQAQAHSPYYHPAHDFGVAVPMGPDHGYMATGTPPRVVLPPTTPGRQAYNTENQMSQGHLRTNIHNSTSLGPFSSRSPMRTTTDAGSPLMRQHRNATEPGNHSTTSSHRRTNSSSGTDLRRWATAQSGFSIAEPRSSPSVGAFSPGPGSPGHGNVTSMTARSSPGLSFSNLGPFGRSTERTSSSHELSYVGFSITGETPGEVSRPPTPPANSGRRWFETRQYVPDGSRMSSPGFTSPGHNGGFYADHRSEDGQM